MVNHNIINRIELSLWDRIIPLMSESPSAQRLIRECYAYYRNPGKQPWVAVLLTTASVLGLGVGLVLSQQGF